MGDDVNTAEAEDIDPKAERLEACFTIASILQLLDSQHCGFRKVQTNYF